MVRNYSVRWRQTICISHVDYHNKWQHRDEEYAELCALADSAADEGLTTFARTK